MFTCLLFSVDGHCFFVKLAVVCGVRCAVSGVWCQVVSRVMKYADNITKVFAASSGVVITMFLSTYLFDFSMTLLFNLGTGTNLVYLTRAPRA